MQTVHICRPRAAHRTLVAALSAALLFFAPLARAQNDDLSDEVRVDLRYHAANLETSADLELRTRAARYLLRMQIPKAIEALDRALRSGDAALARAVVDALAVEPVAPEGLLSGVAHSLSGASPQLRQTIAKILARYEERGVERLADLALDSEQALDLRVGAVYVLGELQHASTVRLSVDTLLGIVRKGDAQPVELTDAAFDSLERLTNLRRFDHNVDAWNDWWNRTREKPIDEWLPGEFERLSERVEVLQRQFAAARGERDQLHTKLDELLTEIYFIFLREKPEAELQTKLAAWLGDPVPEVRRNALGRIDNRAANGDLVDQAVQLALANLMEDEHADIRSASAQLLDRLQYADIGALISTALPNEPDPQARLAFLEILGRRPAPAALPTLVNLLTDPTTQDSAAAAAVVILVSGAALEPELHDTLLTAARAAYQANTTRATVRLLATIGAEEDITKLIARLDDPDETIRQMTADALLTVPTARDDLIARSGDRVIYPTVVALLSNGEATIEAFEHLASLFPPTNDTNQTWRDGMQRLAARLPAHVLIKADEAVKPVPAEHLNQEHRSALRETILARILTVSPDGLAASDRTELLLRLAELRLAAGRADGALEALTRLNGATPSSPRVTSLRFRTFVQLKRFDEAGEIQPEAAIWLDEMEAIVVEDVALAVVIKSEIERRFPDLEETLQERFKALVALLPHDLSDDPDGAAPPSAAFDRAERAG